mgnify:CR=1 FL=1
MNDTYSDINDDDDDRNCSANFFWRNLKGNQFFFSNGKIHASCFSFWFGLVWFGSVDSVIINDCVEVNEP